MGSSHTPQDRAGVAAPLVLDLTSDADLTPAPDMIVFGDPGVALVISRAATGTVIRGGKADAEAI